MSRTYRKYIKCGICTGSNTEYYRDRNRKARQMNRHNLRNLIANKDIEDVSDLVINIELPHDSWNEPTDGTFLVSKKDKNCYIVDRNGNAWVNKHYGNGENYWNHKFGKYLKSKKYKH